MTDITTKSLDTIWSRTLSLIKNHFTDNMQMFDAFFDTTKLASLEGTTATVTTQGQVATMILKNPNYLSLMEEALKEVTQTSYSFRLVDRKTFEANVSPVAAPQERRLNFFSKSRINPKMNFSNFVQGENNREAVQAAIAAVENPGLLNPIFIYSATGYGKTHLLHAIGNAYQERHPSSRVLYTDSNEFINEFIEFSQGQYDSRDFRDYFDTVSILLIDDVQFLSNKKKTCEFFFNIFNSFVSAGKQIVLTSDRAPAELNDLEDRLVSRFSSGLTIPITRPKPDTMLSILKMKVKELDQEKLIGPDVLEYLVAHNPGNIRSMEGDLTRVLFYATSTRTKGTISLEEVEELFGDRGGRGSGERDPITPEKIVRAVAEYYKVATAQIYSKMRTLQVATARKIAMYLCRDMLNMPFTEIGRLFSRDHSTVMSACSAIRKQMKDDPLLNQAIATLKRNLSKKVVENAVEM